MATILVALSDARDASERAQHAARAAFNTSRGEQRAELLRRARTHALATAAAAQRALDLLETT